MKPLRLAAAYFLIVFSVGFVLGLVRVPLLEPRLGTRNAELLEMPFMLAAIYLAARWTVTRFGKNASGRACLAAGMLAASGILAADLLVGVGLRKMSVAQVFLDRAPVSGVAYYLSLAVFALMPWLLKRRR